MPLIPKIEAYFSSKKLDYTVVSTTRRGEATEIARKAALTGEPIRIYACGGDGTVHEVVNGIAGCENVELGIFPCGTGNDYVSTFGQREDFMNVEAQIEGGSVEVDLICTDGIYSINQCSMGFDGAVADNVAMFKKKPLVSGSMAYLLAVIYTLTGKIGNKLTITIDDVHTITGRFLFAISAKGKYHGGGMMSAPDASPTSRSLNFMIVNEVKKSQIPSLLPKYIKGKHKALSGIVTNAFGRKMRVVAERPLPVTLDGEVIYTEEITSELVPRGVKFIIPTTVAVNRDEKASRLAAAVGKSAN